MPNYAKVQEIKFCHREDEINDYLKNGWIIIVPPFMSLRRVNQAVNGKYEPVDIPHTRVMLGRLKKNG